MKHLNPSPINSRQAGESLEKFELRSAGGSGLTRLTLLLYGFAQNRSSFFGRDFGHFTFIVETLDPHLSLPPIHILAAVCSSTSFARFKQSSTEGKTSSIVGCGCLFCVSAWINSAASS